MNINPNVRAEVYKGVVAKCAVLRPSVEECIHTPGL